MRVGGKARRSATKLCRRVAAGKANSEFEFFPGRFRTAFRDVMRGFIAFGGVSAPAGRSRRPSSSSIPATPLPHTTTMSAHAVHVCPLTLATPLSGAD